MNNTSNLKSVEDWNSELARVLIPNDVILSLYIILGISGNTVVILVYGFRMKRKTEDRYFIPVLAVSDLAGSTVCASFGIALNLMQARFYYTHLCKAWWFFAALTTYMSVLLLLVIATQRYLKVCRPLGGQMSLLHKRLAIGITLAVAIVLAGPTTALYGSVDFPNPKRSIVGVRCSKLKDTSKTGTLLYGAVVVIVLVICIIFMIYFYSRIGHKLYNHFKYTAAFTYKKRPSCHEQLNTSFQSGDVSEQSTCTSEIASSIVIASDTTNASGSNQNSKDKAAEINRNMQCSTNDIHGHQNTRIMHKFTIMFMAVTIVFLICFIPKVILMVIEGLNPHFWEMFSDSERAAVLFVYRMYIINNVANPFIYAFMDLEFRREMKYLFMCQTIKKGFNIQSLL